MPNALDALAIAWFLLLALGLPLAGWALMGLDYRAYLRSLRRALTVVKSYQQGLPAWALRGRPRCLVALDLPPGCTREEVLAAYRRCVKQVHPDRGGSEREFQQLQQWLTEALAYAAKSDA
ncbi:J domain-containing protein [Botrimarina hoheduenensis]|uniref:DnaJ domain protein n=1 Tax=Botrimarina hoheduenensis TaxID=2528000 RepID=A0A5C5VY60_9BACT|nr:J domain-containing protein [Botrimarina hoheduenensis]TWT42671.1 DnaJ domain protein [Botrimarina hoheduenensis]